MEGERFFPTLKVMKVDPQRDSWIGREIRAGEKAIRAVEQKTIEPELKIVKRYWGELGPGLTTGAADDDPSGVATYSQVGAKFGFQLAWLTLATFPLMAMVQEMCTRIGLATGQGLATNIRHNFSRTTLLICAFLVLVANSFNLGADLGVMMKASQLLAPQLPSWTLIVFFAAISLIFPIFLSYRRYSPILKWLSLTLIAYILVPFMINGFPWREAFRGLLIPSITPSVDQIMLICGFLGTTISPYLFFWEPAQEVEEEILEGETTRMERRAAATEQKMRRMRIDNWTGMFFSNIVSFFIVIAVAGVLFKAGITSIDSAEQAAAALRPLAGNYAYLIFALGIVSTGLLAVPILAGSAAYAVAEGFGWKTGLYRKLGEASAFYGVMGLAILIGLTINFIGLNPIKALIYSAVLNGMVAPVILVTVVRLASNKGVMGQWASRPFVTFVGWGVVAIMALAGTATLIGFFL